MFLDFCTTGRLPVHFTGRRLVVQAACLYILQAGGLWYKQLARTFYKPAACGTRGLQYYFKLAIFFGFVYIFWQKWAQ